MVAEQARDRRDRRRDRRHDGKAAFGIPDRRLQHVGQAKRAMVPQHHQPGVEGARDHRRQQAGARNRVEVQVGEGVDRGRLRRHPLATDDPRPPLLGIAQDDRHLAAGSIEVGLHHLQDETGGHRRVEGVAAALQHGHSGRRRQPVGRRHHAEGSAQFGACCEHRHLNRRFARPAMPHGRGFANHAMGPTGAKPLRCTAFRAAQGLDTDQHAIVC